jgi:hypothetical protein
VNQFSGKRNGRQFLELRLEPGNLELLTRAGAPIKTRIEDMFPDGIPDRLDLYISYSETPIADARELEQSAEVALDERTHISQAKRPHCPECKSTVEQLAALKHPAAPTVFCCATCGCVLGVAPSE